MKSLPPHKARLLNSRIAREPRGFRVPPDPAKPPKVRDSIAVIRIDPATRAVARLILKMSTEPADGAAEVARVCRANRIGSHPLGFNHSGYPIMAAGNLDADIGQPGWRIQASATTRGVSIIFAIGPGGGMTSVPFGADWAREQIHWVKPNDEGDA